MAGRVQSINVRIEALMQQKERQEMSSRESVYLRPVLEPGTRLVTRRSGEITVWALTAGRMNVCDDDPGKRRVFFLLVLFHSLPLLSFSYAFPLLGVFAFRGTDSPDGLDLGGE